MLRHVILKWQIFNFQLFYYLCSTFFEIINLETVLELVITLSSIQLSSFLLFNI